MYGVIIALVPAILASFYFFGLGSAVVLLTSVAACVFFEWAITVNEKPIPVEETPSHGRETSIRVRIPPLGAVYLQGRGVFKQKKGADHP